MLLLAKKFGALLSALMLAVAVLIGLERYVFPGLPKQGFGLAPTPLVNWPEPRSDTTRKVATYPVPARSSPDEVDSTAYHQKIDMDLFDVRSGRLFCRYQHGGGLGVCQLGLRYADGSEHLWHHVAERPHDAFVLKPQSDILVIIAETVVSAVNLSTLASRGVLYAGPDEIFGVMTGYPMFVPCYRTSAISIDVAVHSRSLQNGLGDCLDQPLRWETVQ